MLERRYIAEQPADLVHGVGFWAVRRDQCRWPLTDILPISDFKYCGKEVVCRCWCAVHADQALRPHPPKSKQPAAASPLQGEKRSAPPPQPTLTSESTPAPAAIEHAAVTCRCRDRSLQALQRAGFEADEAHDIVARMLAAPCPSAQLAVWRSIEPRVQRRPHVADGRTTEPRRGDAPDPIAPQGACAISRAS
jgi:hypothetical protein